MELVLTRTYHAAGTNGELSLHVCNTIELPWLKNQRNVSCIPEGRYALQARTTATRGKHLLVMDVPGRNHILFHPANDAQQELRGCIAPVTLHTGPGKGSYSRLAHDTLTSLVFHALAKKENVFITIKSI